MLKEIIENKKQEILELKSKQNIKIEVNQNIKNRGFIDSLYKEETIIDNDGDAVRGPASIISLRSVLQSDNASFFILVFESTAILLL